MKKIGVIGLGYVGLPLAKLFSTRYSVVGYDIDKARIEELKAGKDSTLEVDENSLKQALINENTDQKGLFCTYDQRDLTDCNFYIVTVPTPVDSYNNPVFTPLLSASKLVGKLLKKGDIVIYESTVYPGATEEECVPVLESESGLVFNKDFFVGYSPERINPGDRKHTVDKIVKVTSGSTEETGKTVDELYASVILAGTHLAPSIKVAEAAKVIENSQRDINIAFVNELAKIFSLMSIDTNDVLNAASTKWNFLPFKPGLVGGHCIGVDPYYLAQKAQEVGYHPEIILAGRRLNDSMGQFIAGEVIKEMARKGQRIKGAKTLILGITFKENCPDIRNTKVIDIYKELNALHLDVDVYDPWASFDDVKKEYGIEILKNKKALDITSYSSIILAVAHDVFRDLNINKSADQVVYDVKGFFERQKIDKRL